MTIPKEILFQLEVLCEKHDYGMLILQGEDHNAIVMGHRKWSPDQVSIIVTHSLLGGVISSEINALNDEMAKARETERKM
jgi:hypothetical protein